VKIKDVPFEDLRIGDKVVSLIGNRGVIAGLYPIGSVTPLGGEVKWNSDWGPEILFLWQSGGCTWSLAGHNFLEVEYIGR
jgi:hypothetical protein